MQKSYVDAKTKEVNELARNFFKSNKIYVTDSFFRVRPSKDPEKHYQEDEYALNVNWSDQYLLYDSNKIFWNHAFYDMDEETKRFSEKMHRDLQRINKSQWYEFWYFWKEWIILAAIGGTCIGVFSFWAHNSKEKQNTEKHIDAPQEKVVENAINYHKAKADFQKYTNGISCGKSY